MAAEYSTAQTAHFVGGCCFVISSCYVMNLCLSRGPLLGVMVGAEILQLLDCLIT